MSQLSLFAAGMNDPSYDDLVGLLAGPGSIERRGDAARVQVVVREDWRVAVLLAGLAVMGADADVVAEPSGRVVVRTGFVTDLFSVAQRWHSSSGKVAPPGLRLDGAKLWWWCVAAGASDSAGYRLGLGHEDGDGVWAAAGSALAATGVAAALVGQRAAGADGPAYRVVGARRLVRLAELVGAAPAGVPPGAWPVPRAAHVGMAPTPGSDSAREGQPG